MFPGRAFLRTCQLPRRFAAFPVPIPGTAIAEVVTYSARWPFGVPAFHPRKCRTGSSNAPGASTGARLHVGLCARDNLANQCRRATGGLGELAFKKARHDCRWRRGSRPQESPCLRRAGVVRTRQNGETARLEPGRPVASPQHREGNSWNRFNSQHACRRATTFQRVKEIAKTQSDNEDQCGLLGSEPFDRAVRRGVWVCRCVNRHPSAVVDSDRCFESHVRGLNADARLGRRCPQRSRGRRGKLREIRLGEVTGGIGHGMDSASPVPSSRRVDFLGIVPGVLWTLSCGRLSGRPADTSSGCLRCARCSRCLKRPVLVRSCIGWGYARAARRAHALFVDVIEITDRTERHGGGTSRRPRREAPERQAASPPPSGVSL